VRPLQAPQKGAPLAARRLSQSLGRVSNGQLEWNLQIAVLNQYQQNAEERR
jgi:hypothetical protein